METETAIPNRRRWPDCVLICLFALALALPVLDMIFHIDPTTPPSENRLLAVFPQRPGGIAGLKKFLAGWEIYFNDHFGCRKTLIAWHNKLMWSFFKDANARNVLTGTGGWFFSSEKRMVENFRGAAQFSEPELQAWQKLLEHRRDWLAKRGVKYVFVIAPDKHDIYPEHLPAWLKDLGGRTKADQFFDYMKTHSTVQVLDVRPALLAAKKNAPVFLKTDTHWNQFGAFAACEDLVRALAENQLPGLAPVSLDSFIVTNRLEAGGDLVNLRGIRLSMAESNAFMFKAKSDLPALKIFIPAEDRVKDEATSKNPLGHGLAFICTDSFGRAWIPFLGYQFGETDFFWQPNLDGARIEKEKPVVVVTEMVERFFNVTDPQELSAQDALP